MVVKVQKSPVTIINAVEYNERKCWRRVAMPVDSNLVDISDISSVYETFEQWENNPRIPQQTRSRGFHMTVNPSEEDGMDTEKAKAYIHELMQSIGFGGQPYVVYRHRDIDRVHYHVCSVKFDRDGRRLDEMAGRKILKVNKELSEKYGFTIGKADRKESLDIPEEKAPAAVREEAKTPSYTKGQDNVFKTMADCVEEAMKYQIVSLSQFQHVMRSMNIRATVYKRRETGYSVVLQGLDENGHRSTVTYSADKIMDKAVGEMLSSRINECKAAKAAPSERTEQDVTFQAKLRFCFNESRSLEEFAGLCKGLGMGVTASRKPDGSIARLIVSDPQSHLLADSAHSGIKLDRLNAAEESGKWTRPETAKQGVVVKAIAFTSEMMKALADFIRKALERFRDALSGRRESTAPGGGKSLKKL